MIYALLSWNFVVRIYVLFPQIFSYWKAESADDILFWMYNHTMDLIPQSVKRSEWEDLHSSGGLSFNWEKHHLPSSASDAPPPSILKIAKRISPNGKMYLFKVLNVFVKVGQCISPNGNICSNCKISNHLPSSASVSRPPSSVSLLPHFQWFKILLPTKCWIENNETEILEKKQNPNPVNWWEWYGVLEFIFLHRHLQYLKISEIHTPPHTD